MVAAPDRPVHVPVLLDEVVELLVPTSGGVVLDLTVGAGGHAERLLEVADGVTLVGLDQDSHILALARRRLDRFGDRVHLEQVNFHHVRAVCQRLGIDRVSGALLDLGVSSLQLDDPERGFSFDRDGPLDMRMDADNPRSAADLINQGSREELLHAIGTLGEERKAPRIVDEIVRMRQEAPLLRTCELADLVRRYVRGSRHHHPATRTFLGLRMAVNDELGCVERALPVVVDLLATGARAMVISFHGGEDRIVKRTFQKLEKQGLLRVVTRRPVLPGFEERNRNPRARSARARVVERLRGGARGD